MNVLIYFTEERRRTLVQKFYESLEPGGYLFLGHSESISKMPVKFQAIVRAIAFCTVSRRRKSAEAGIGGGGTRVSMPDRESVEMFLQEASEHLQYLRSTWVCCKRFHRAAKTWSGCNCGAHAQRHFGELRLPKIFGGCGEAGARLPVCVNAPLGGDLHGPLTEFLSDGISVLETCLAGNERHRAGERGGYGRVQGEVPLCLSA